MRSFFLTQGFQGHIVLFAFSLGMIQLKKEKNGDRMDLRKQKETQDEKMSEISAWLTKKRFNPAWTEERVRKKTSARLLDVVLY